MDYIIGTIIQYGSDTIPEGWLLCDGSAVSRTTYADLYAVIGTTFGAGNGSTTFNVPNLKGKVGVGKDGTQTEFDTLGETGGEKTHTLSIDEMPSHNHAGAVFGKGGALSAEGLDASVVWGSGTMRTTTNGISIDNKGGGQAHNILQPYLVTNYIIKALKVTPEGTKISDLRELQSLDDSDIIPIVDVSADETMKITKQNLVISNNTYSTTEQVIGTFDGKPLYRKIITGNKTEQLIRIDISSLNIDTILMPMATLNSTAGNKYIFPFRYSDTVWLMVETSGNDLVIEGGSNSSYCNGNYKIVLEYTKTSDTV